MNRFLSFLDEVYDEDILENIRDIFDSGSHAATGAVGASGGGLLAILLIVFLLVTVVTLAIILIVFAVKRSHNNPDAPVDNNMPQTGVPEQNSQNEQNQNRS
ncbi:MAG: hypothetical protein IK071_06570 [Lachnospiraceae bacterium]|nr:hypothetical protein [Lachnospiraceae bacterium]